MKPKRILIAGSANESCDGERLERALEFVREATFAILRSGNSVTVFAGREPVNADKRPVVFDWEVLRAVDDYLKNEAGSAERIMAQVVTGADSLEKRFSEENASLIQRLQSAGAIEAPPLSESLHTGGNYRAELVKLSDAMIAVGGGTGVYDTGRKMTDEGKPVMPVDIHIGSSQDDGDGALQLMDEMKADPQRFLPYGYEVVNKKMLALSLEHPYKPTPLVANDIVRILTLELAGRNNKALRFADALARPIFRIIGKPSLSIRGMYYGAKILEIFDNLNVGG